MIETKFKDIIKNIKAYETFNKMSELQKFENIDIELGIPFSELKFKKEDTKIALQVLTIKTLLDFNNPRDDYKFYLNNKEIDQNDFLLDDEDPYNFIDHFIKKYKCF